MKRLDELKNLIVMAVADGALAEDEVGFLTDRCVELGMGEAELQHAISYALSETAALRLPTEALAQEQMLRDLIRMMAADGVLAESEKRLFALAAAKMKFDTSRLDEIVSELVSGVDSKQVD